MIDKIESEIIKNWKGDEKIPLVSICCITYNHEKFISEALDSFLMQVTDFPFEIIVRDDASLDNTRNIIEKYYKRFPKIIKPILEEENTYSKGVKPFKETTNLAIGKYIALCEGDDYWTDNKKLQIQADILEKNSIYSSVAHQAVVLDGEESKDFSHSVKTDYVLDDLIFERKFHTASLVFRRDILKKYPLPSNVLSGDKMLILLLALCGKIRFINKRMCVYRKHEGGISSWVNMGMMKQDINMVSWLTSIDKNFPKYKLLSFIHRTILIHSSSITLKGLCIHTYYFICYSFSYFPRNIKNIAGFFLRDIALLIRKINS
jgi:glycosyltransferase involved in cell wall biosynthesis